jgi:hypothetical protein
MDREDVSVTAPQVQWKDKAPAAAASMAYVRHQITRMAYGKDPRPATRPLEAFAADRYRRGKKLERSRAWLPHHPLSPTTPVSVNQS